MATKPPDHPKPPLTVAPPPPLVAHPPPAAPSTTAPPNPLPSEAQRSWKKSFASLLVKDYIPIVTQKSHFVKDGKPAITYSKDEVSKLASPFKYALVGKFSHGRPPMMFMRKGLQALGFLGEFSIIHVDGKHILLNFAREDDYSRCWLKGSWFVEKFPMRVLKWTPYFCSSVEPSIVPLWISFPNLPIFLYEKSSMFYLASSIGKPLKMDECTSEGYKFSKARVCVEVDLLKELQRLVWIEFEGDEGLVGFWQEVHYEKIPPYCSKCNHLGHIFLDCKFGDVDGDGKKNNLKEKIIEKHKEVLAAPPLERGRGGGNGGVSRGNFVKLAKDKGTWIISNKSLEKGALIQNKNLCVLGEKSSLVDQDLCDMTNGQQKDKGKIQNPMSTEIEVQVWQKEDKNDQYTLEGAQKDNKVMETCATKEDNTLNAKTNILKSQNISRLNTCILEENTNPFCIEPRKDLEKHGKFLQGTVALNEDALASKASDRDLKTKGGYKTQGKLQKQVALNDKSCFNRFDVLGNENSGHFEEEDRLDVTEKAGTSLQILENLGANLQNSEVLGADLQNSDFGSVSHVSQSVETASGKNFDVGADLQKKESTGAKMQMLEKLGTTSQNSEKSVSGDLQAASNESGTDLNCGRTEMQHLESSGTKVQEMENSGANMQKSANSGSFPPLSQFGSGAIVPLNSVSLKQSIIQHFRNHRIKVGPSFKYAIGELVKNVVGDSTNSLSDVASPPSVSTKNKVVEKIQDDLDCMGFENCELNVEASIPSQSYNDCLEVARAQIEAYESAHHFDHPRYNENRMHSMDEESNIPIGCGLHENGSWYSDSDEGNNDESPQVVNRILSKIEDEPKDERARIMKDLKNNKRFNDEDMHKRKWGDSFKKSHQRQGSF